MHPFCRSTTLAVLPSEEELDKAFEDFKADNIPEGMDFDEWLDGLEPTEDGKLVFRDKGSKATVSEGKSDIEVIKGNPLGDSEKYLSYSGGKRVDNPDINDIIEEVKKTGIRGDSFNIPPKPIDVNKLKFNDKHTNADRKHNVTEQEAKSFIENADISITRELNDDTLSENYYSQNGAAYVIDGIQIKTAFKSSEYDDKTDDMMKIFRKGGANSDK